MTPRAAIAACAIVLGSVLMLSLAWGLQHAALTSPTLLGNAAPRLAIQTLDGQQVRVWELRKPVVVNFWASWCTTCVDKLPILSNASHRSTSCTPRSSNSRRPVPSRPRRRIWPSFSMSS